MRIHFIRHAQADYSLEKLPGEFPGVPLTELGKQQARELAGKLCTHSYDAVFCSDMQRTKQTIEPSLSFLPEPIYESCLREISDAVTSNHDNNWFEEPKENQIRRMELFLEKLKTLSGNILVVAHFGVIKYLSERLGKKIESPEHTGHYIVDLD